MKRVKVGLPSIPTEVQNANILEIFLLTLILRALCLPHNF